MKQHWRIRLDWLHSWFGLLAGWGLYFVFVTGTLGYVDTEIDRWMQPELPPPTPVAVIPQVAIAESYLQRQAPQAAQWRVFIAADRNQPWLKVQWRYAGTRQYRSQLLSPVTGEPLAARTTGGGKSLYRMHYAFHYLPGSVARWLVSLLAMVLLLTLLSGVFIHRHILRDWFTFRPGKRLRTGLDLHLLAGVSVLPFLLMISYSGLLFYLPMHFPQFAQTAVGPTTTARTFNQVLAQPTGTAPSQQEGQRLPMADLVRQTEPLLGQDQVRRVDLFYPGDEQALLVVYPRTQQLQRQEMPLMIAADTGRLLSGPYRPHGGVRAFYEGLLGIHEGTFAQPWLRAGYLFSGLMGCIAILSGLLIWEVKRVKRLAGKQGYRLVSGLNLGVVVGLPLAIGIYFIANRALPLDLPDRAGWEMHSLCLGWGLALGVALGCERRRGWVGLSALTGVSYISLPLLSVYMSPNNLGLSWQRADWSFFGFELAVLIVGSGWIMLSLYLQRRWDLRHG